MWAASAESTNSVSYTHLLAQMQKDYILREQLKVLQEELGESDPNSEAMEYQERILALELPREIEEKLLKETERMAKQPLSLIHI